MTAVNEIRDPINRQQSHYGMMYLLGAAAGESVQYRMAAQVKQLAHSLRDPRMVLFLELRKLADAKAALLHEALSRNGAEHSLPLPPSSVEVPTAILEGFFQEIGSFGWPEMKRWYNQLRQRAWDFRDGLTALNDQTPILTPEEQEMLLALNEAAVSQYDQALSRMRKFDLDAEPGESSWDPDWYPLPSQLEPRPGRDFPHGPHYQG